MIAGPRVCSEDRLAILVTSRVPRPQERGLTTSSTCSCGVTERLVAR
ncbi:MAG: hypothetical protein JWP95_866 [Actinotalea sp.]|nr:hypothetical protein [Actinotalea sp.]